MEEAEQDGRIAGWKQEEEDGGMQLGSQYQY